MMNAIWAILVVGGCAAVLGAGDGGDAMTRSAVEAVQLSIRMAGSFALFTGLLEIVRESGAMRLLQRLLRRPLAFLFPGVDPQGEAAQAMSVNIAANMLGLGNAATPMGIRAMEALGRGRGGDAATDAMCMFMVLNASSVQLFPTSVVALRSAAGSAAPASIVLPTLIATAVSTATGIFFCKLFARGGAAHGR